LKIVGLAPDLNKTGSVPRPHGWLINQGETDSIFLAAWAAILLRLLSKPFIHKKTGFHACQRPRRRRGCGGVPGRVWLRRATERRLSLIKKVMNQFFLISFDAIEYIHIVHLLPL
jgi:hypothetical protein